MWTVDTGLTALPFETFRRLAHLVEEEETWAAFSRSLSEAGELSPDELHRLSLQANPGQALLHRLSRSHNVKGLIRLFHNAHILRPQLLLHRKFEKVKMSKIRRSEEESGVRLSVTAKAFPYPNFEWRLDGEPTPVGSGPSLFVSQCAECGRGGAYRLRVWNCVEPGSEWAAHYAAATSGTESSMETAAEEIRVGLDSCGVCVSEAVAARVRSVLLDDESAAAPAPQPDEAEESCSASDKVALIICNAEYQQLPPLITPPCDAAALAAGLVAQGFKTVTLADLGLCEMRRLIREYSRLLGEGVYAVFYFVGHGLEAGGKCYLLPVDAPGREYSPEDCVGLEWIRAQLHGTNPALNLILLDMCRKYPPQNLDKFTAVNVDEPVVSANRNTVLGFATSCGVGAYEVRGEENGVFMKYLKEYLSLDKTVLHILNKVLRDLELDPKASEVQFPEVRSSLSRPRKLTDPIRQSGHTASFDQRTLEWQLIHHLPDPVAFPLPLPHLNHLRVLVWFDYFGHFTNMVYVFTSVIDTREEGEATVDPHFLADLQFPPALESCNRKVCTDSEEGTSVRCLLRGLQKLSAAIPATLELREGDDVRAHFPVQLGPLLITRLPKHEEEE